MSSQSLTPAEEAFIAQSERFVEIMLRGELPCIAQRPAVPFEPVIVKDYRALAPQEIDLIATKFSSEFALAPFIVRNADDYDGGRHPLAIICDQLAETLGLHHPLGYPFEGPDGTYKIRESTTDNAFLAHCDGLGYAGSLQTVAFYMDSPPLSGGYTYFQNITRVALDLARDNYPAFRELFLPDAMTVTVPRGKKTIRVKSPVLFLNEDGHPQSAFRVSSQGYEVQCRRDRPLLNEALAYLQKAAEPFAAGSAFLHFTAPGHGCFFRNQVLAHGRTPYIDDPQSPRVLSRIWFMSAAQHATYRNAPGTLVLDEYARLFPQYFGPDQVNGEWMFDRSSGRNYRLR